MNTPKKNILQFLLTAIIVLGSFSSCKKDFFDINTNPNSPTDVPIKYILPSAEAGIAHAVGNDLQIYGGIWGQFWTQSPSSSQYKTIEQYVPSASDFDRPWANLYSDALEDLKTVVSKGTALGQTQYVACAKILQAYAYQLLTDNFGDIPFTQSLQAETGVIAPHYDSQSTVYSGIITLVDDGLAMIDENLTGTPGTPSDDDLLLGGDMSLWKKFGNTLKLKIYLRLSEVDPAKAHAGITELETSGAVFLGSGEDVKVNYTAEGGNTNPLVSSFINLTFVQNLVASKTAIDYLSNNADPRLNIFYDADINTGTQIGIPQGAYNSPPGTPVSYPSTTVGGNGSTADLANLSATAPVKLMTGYESLFLQAEAAARTWLTGDAQTLYEAAITENFVSYGFDPDSAIVYYTNQPAVVFPSGGTAQDKIRAISIQKWIAMCGTQNDEAWIESRRINAFDTLFHYSVTSLIGNTFPKRLLYPANEVGTNGSFPGQKNVTDKVWWDAN